MMIDRNGIGARIRVALARKDMTKSELAKTIAVTDTTVGMWAAGHIYDLSRLSTAIKIAEALDMSLDYMVFGGTDDENRRHWP